MTLAPTSVEDYVTVVNLAGAHSVHEEDQSPVPTDALGLYGLIGIVVVLCMVMVLGVVLHKRRQQKVRMQRRFKFGKTIADDDGDGIYDDARILQGHHAFGGSDSDDLKIGRRVVQPKWLASMPEANLELNWDDNEMYMSNPQVALDGDYSDASRGAARPGNADYDQMGNFEYDDIFALKPKGTEYMEANRPFSLTPGGFEEEFAGHIASPEGLMSPEGFEDDMPQKPHPPAPRLKRAPPAFRTSIDFTSLPFEFEDVDDDANYMKVRTEAAMQRYLEGNEEASEYMQMRDEMREGFQSEYLDHGGLVSVEYLKSGEYLKAGLEYIDSAADVVEGEYLKSGLTMTEEDDDDDDELYFAENADYFAMANTAPSPKASMPKPRPRPPPPPSAVQVTGPPPPASPKSKLAAPKVSQNDELAASWLQSLSRHSQNLKLPETPTAFMTMLNATDSDDDDDDAFLSSLGNAERPEGDYDEPTLPREQLLSRRTVTKWERPGELPESPNASGPTGVLSPPKWKSALSDGLGYVESAFGTQATPSTKNPLWQYVDSDDDDSDNEVNENLTISNMRH